MTRTLLNIFATVVLFLLPARLAAFSYVESIVNLGIDAPGKNYLSTINFTSGHIGWLQTATWGHSLSADFMTVPDQFTVQSATLEIIGWRAFGFGMDLVQVGGTYHWTKYDGWAWVSQTDNLFDISNISPTYWNSSPLYVSMTPVFDYGIWLESSVLSVDYDPVSSGSPPAAVPEPATLLLFGIGLLGTGIARHRIRLTA